MVLSGPTVRGLATVEPWGSTKRSGKVEFAGEPTLCRRFTSLMVASPMRTPDASANSDSGL